MAPVADDRGARPDSAVTKQAPERGQGGVAFRGRPRSGFDAKRLLDDRVGVGAEEPPVLARLEDLLRAADRLEVADQGRRLSPAKQCCIK